MSEEYTQPYFVTNIENNKNVKNVTKFSKTVIFAFISIALVGGIAIGTLISGPIKEYIKNWSYSQKKPSSDSDNNQSAETDNSIVNEEGFLIYATEENDASALSTAEIAAKCLPSVVEIRTETVTTGSFFQEFVTEGAGSGVIITKDGYIVTNYHVIAETNAIFVTLNSSKEYEAKLIGFDEKSDLAVVKIEATDLIPAVIGDSDKLVVGEKAVAIGNPLGELGGTVTDGIISALDREMTIEGQKLTLLQTNAAINPGNSGGGLFNGLGNLIAIVDAKSSGTGIEGLGFAIPSNKMSDVVNQIIKYGYVKGYVDTGMTFIDINDYYTAMQYRVNEFGVYVLKVYGDSALEAGFQSGDLILSVNGKSVDTAAEINSIIENMNVSDNVEFKIYRGRSTLTLKLKLDEYIPKSQA
ncbi:MAG: PDZ domain-containing protein [Ruminococcaceae bacterium]|nr:PDZ domain-containing protein [Oscillospiraceae bacterium]